MSQRVHVAVPVGGTTLIAEDPYGRPSQYFERSVFPVYDAQAQRCDDGSVTSSLNLGSRGNRRHRSGAERDSIDIRDSTEAMRNPDVAAAFAAAAAAAESERVCDDEDSFPVDGQAQYDRGGVTGIPCEALAQRNRRRNYHATAGTGSPPTERGSQQSSQYRREHTPGGAPSVSHASRRPGTSYEMVASESNSYTTSAELLSEHGECIAGVPITASRHRHRSLHRSRRLDSSGYGNRDGATGDTDTSAVIQEDVVRAVVLTRPPTPLTGGGGPRGSARSTPSSRTGSRDSTASAASGSFNGLSVKAEMNRRRGEVHDPECICTLCEERRRKAEPPKKAEKLRERLNEGKACSNMAFCAMM